jgi:hypothetical protein
MIRQDRAPSVHGKWSLGDRAHRPYRPPQLLTGHVNGAPSVHGERSLGDRAPLEPEKPIDIAPARIYGLTPTQTVPEYFTALKALGGDTPGCIAALLGIPLHTEPQSPPPQPAGPDEPTSLVLASKPADFEAPTTAATAASDEIEVAPPSALSPLPRQKKKPNEGKKPGRRKKSPSRRKSSKRPAPEPPHPMSALARHRIRCGICGSEWQQEIDEAFTNWESVDEIVKSFNHVNRRALYRHAHATGLFARRDRNIRRALGLIINRADEVRDVTADSVIRAAKTLTHINAHGQWVQPPTHVIFSTATNQSISSSRAQSRRVTVESHADDSIDTRCQLKNRLKP